MPDAYRITDMKAKEHTSYSVNGDNTDYVYIITVGNMRSANQLRTHCKFCEGTPFFPALPGNALGKSNCIILRKTHPILGGMAPDPIRSAEVKTGTAVTWQSPAFSLFVWNFFGFFFCKGKANKPSYLFRFCLVHRVDALAPQARGKQCQASGKAPSGLPAYQRPAAA